MIKLPSFDWFMGQLNFHGKGNIYSGSFGTDPLLGGIGDNVYRYRVWVEKDENDAFVLKAVYYKGSYSYGATDKSIMTEKSFEACTDGIAEAQKWINLAFESHSTED